MEEAVRDAPFSIPVPIKVLASIAAASYLAHRFYFSGGVNGHNNVDLRRKIAVVTGGNGGIGFETALQLAKNGAEVVIACRESQKTKDAVASIVKLSGNANVSYEVLDLASMASIRRFAARWKETNRPIHILVNNAGVMTIMPRAETEDGLEMQLGVNHLGHFLLTNVLLENIREAADLGGPVRIVNLSSHASEGGSIDWDDLMKAKPGAYQTFTVYKQSKLANVLFTKELQRRLRESDPKSDIIATSVHPGGVRTDISRYSLLTRPMIRFFLFTVLKPLLIVMMKTPWEGAQTSLYCALAPSGELVPGEYYADCVIKNHPVDATRDPGTWKRFWTVSEKLVGL